MGTDVSDLAARFRRRTWLASFATRMGISNRRFLNRKSGTLA